MSLCHLAPPTFLRRATLPLLLLFLAGGAARAALAYSETEAFDKDPSEGASGGGGGILFTGSPRQHGLECASCHLGGPSDIKLRVSALLVNDRSGGLFVSGYHPGVLYQIEVAFDQDRLVPKAGCRDHDFEPCNLNLFAGEILDQDAKPQGVLCPVKVRDDPGLEGCDACPLKRASGSRTTDHCQAILADPFNPVDARWRNGVTTTSFFWKAPAKDVGPLTLYLSAVDGLGQEDPAGEATSSLNDGTATLKIPLGPAPKSGGCSGSPPLALLLLGLGGLFSRRKRRASWLSS